MGIYDDDEPLLDLLCGIDPPELRKERLAIQLATDLRRKQEIEREKNMKFEMADFLFYLFWSTFGIVLIATLVYFLVS